MRFSLRSYFYLTLFTTLFAIASGASYFSQSDAFEQISKQDQKLSRSVYVSSLRSLNMHLSMSMGDAQDLPQILEKVHQHLQSHPLQLNVNGETLTVLPEPLGQGGRGIVYPVLGSKFVVKIPRPDWISIFRLREEGAKATELEAIAQKESIQTPRNIFFDRLGLFAVKERVYGKTLTEVLIQEGLIEVRQSPDRKWSVLAKPLSQLKVQYLKEQIEHILKARKRAREFLGDLGPNNFLVENGVIYYVDIGSSFEGTLERYDKVRTVTDFIEMSARDIQKYFESDQQPISLGQKVRICRQAHAAG